jgi:hypothetical protein
MSLCSNWRSHQPRCKIPRVVWKGIDRSSNNFTRPSWDGHVSQMDGANDEMRVV